ncbi:outer dynein arm-docking complex subunit 1-like [Watersipora subatra]|uniref:outer dynein arm-docking complex subunit 1-like n=1 Tax=Watersipora subatra TaxID=2589382 RepID=UPI00355C196D
MPRARSPESDNSDAEEGLAELEMQKLSRQLRIMEGDREAYTQETQNLIRKQKNEIDQLEGEKKELHKDLRLAESRSNQVADEGNADKLKAIVEARDEKDREIEEERNIIEKLTAEQKEWEKKIKEQHKMMGGVHMSAAHTAKTQKEIRTLENRLDKSLKKFNSMLTGNADLRQEIDSLRVERKRFEGMHKKLDKELTSLRRQIAEEIDQSTISYDTRDEAQAKMILLKERADKDLQQHNAEMKELVRILDHDRKLKEFMGIKGQERQEDAQLKAWREQREQKEAELKKETQEDSVDSYERAWDRIKEITGEEEVELLVRRFIEVEDRNFALFNYVNEQHNEIELLQEQIQQINDEIAAFKDQGMEMEAQRKVILKQLEDRQVKASKEADDYEVKVRSVNKILDQLKAGVDSLFNKINCNRGAIDDMLGAQAGVSDQNMLQYLGIIEQRTNELLSVKDYQASKDYDRYDPKAPGLIGVGPQPPAPPSHIMPPSVGDDLDSEPDEVSEDEARPMTRSELQQRVIKTVRKRESAMRKEGFRYDLSNAREKTQKKK